MLDTSRLGLSGQARVYECWESRLQGRTFVTRQEVELRAMIAELAHVSVVARDGDGFRFRLAGTALRQALGREARGVAVGEFIACDGQWAWNEALDEALGAEKAVVGRTRLSDGSIHFWMRLPMSSDGAGADMVLCHDRFLPAESLGDLEAAARKADQDLRLDVLEAA
jgi:hypothetical protein